jgi:hypothetical protein
MAASALAIELNPPGAAVSKHGFIAKANISTTVSGDYWPTTVPYMAVEGVTSGPIAEVSDTIGLQEFIFPGVPYTFYQTFNHTRSAENGSKASIGTLITFTVDEDAPYDISGDYTITDVNGFSNPAYLRVDLTDTTIMFGDILLFSNHQSSIFTFSEKFVIGEAGGDRPPTLSGSQTGMLYAGNVYELFFSAGIGTPGTQPECCGSASGGVVLKVPEPTSMLMLPAGIGCLLLFDRRRSYRS